MDRNNPWYSHQNTQYSYQDYTHNQQPDPRSSRVSADPVQDAHGLLAAYPMASATPSTHVARHLNTMTIGASAPSFVQPNFYSLHGSSYPQGNPPPYTEYATEIDYLASSHPQHNDSGYWERTRDQAVRLIGEQAGPSYSYPTHTQWSPIIAQPSNYHTNPFAQSLFQRTSPSASYPTPPPPGISTSSSSLAFALGAPIPRPSRSVYQPQQSATFFNDFLVQKTLDIAPVYEPATPTHHVDPLPQESPDPLALLPVPSRAVSSTTAVTPRKRKPVIIMESPSIKRIHSAASSHRPSASPSTPHSHSSSVPPITPSTGSTKATPKKRFTEVYVEVPYRPWMTPSTAQRTDSTVKSAKSLGKMKINDSPDELGDWELRQGEDDYSPTRRRVILKSNDVKSSSRRTGDRDERAPLEKLTALIEDIFEAEDILPADVGLDDLSPEFFSQMTSDFPRPLLHPNLIRKLTKFICQVARPTKRLRQGTSGGPGTPRNRGRMAEVETAVLSRILKILERSVKAGENVDPFAHTLISGDKPVSFSPRKASNKNKATKKDRRSKSKTPKDDEEDGDNEDNDSATLVDGPDELGDADFEQLTRTLETARDSILAADCCIALLGSDRLTKQLYSEELITSCLATVKNQLTKIIYPFVESSADTGSQSNPFVQYLVKGVSVSSHNHRRQLSETFQALSAVLPRINSLVNAETVAMSDSIIIQAVYIAIGPFFVVESGGDEDAKGKKDNIVLRTFGKSAMRGLRLDALSLIRSIFANHEEQRSWIIEEILTSLIKLSDTKQKAGQFRLRDGRSIRTVSALLLQLVQTSAHDIRIEAKKIQKARQQTFALRRQESFTEQEATPEPFLDDNDMQEIHLYGSGLESATKAAKTIVLFLTQRSGKGKTTKNSNEAEYRAIFDNLISDLLAVLYWPEWPAASLLLSIACKFMVSSLDDVKTSTQTDSNASKTIALDHLGVIAARIQSSILKCQQSGAESGSKALLPLDEIVPNHNLKGLEKLLTAHQEVASHLCKRSSEDQAYDSARELTAATLGQELAASLKQINVWISDSDDDDLNLKDQKTLLMFGSKIKTALQDVWKDPATDVFDIGSQEEVSRIDRLAEEIGTVQGLRSSFHPILNVILLALDAPPIFMRTKALRALGQIVTSDPSILSTPNVRRAIESHLLDSSPAVRDAAVELIGKYMIDSPEVAGDYYLKIADRIADTGLSVRKRVIKLLKSFYYITDDNERRINIGTRLVLRMMDEDDTVKDLAVKTVEELWFQTPLPVSILKSRNPLQTNPHDKSPLLTKVAVIMGVSANFKDRQSPLEDVLHKIMADKQHSEASSLHARYAEICETLIDGLVDASDLPGFTVINCVRTIHLFTSAYPAILSGSNASTLLPYLKNATTPEEQATSDYLLKIFRASIPHMPKTAAKFGHELQMALQPMITKPSTSGGVSALQETVACMCAVVQNLTHDFVRLVALAKSCDGQLQKAIRRPVSQTLTTNETRTWSILIFIISLLGEHCNFDRLRIEHPALAPDLNAISRGSIIEHIYNSLLQLYEKYNNPPLKSRILQCLGFLFRAQPTLMTLEQSQTIMDAIFASSEEEGRGRLLRILQEFLVSEAAKHSAKEKENTKGSSKPTNVDMDELVGNTDGFADSGVSSAVIQRYIGPIHDAALSNNVQIQATAIDVLSFTIKQGLAHPLQSFPVIVALETSSNVQMSARASALHAVLHSKHTTLINTRYAISARASFDYQKTLCSGPVRGFRMQPIPVALLQHWYSLVREKRPARQDFLKALVKVFDVNQKSSQDDVDFIRYMAENFATLDYKTQEEVFTIIKSLTSVLSTSGTQLLEIISPSHLLAQLRGPPQQSPMNSENVLVPVEHRHPLDLQDNLAFMRSSIIVGIVMLLKTHLKTLYGISEDKCAKFVIGKKSAVGDKPAIKRNDKAISWDRLPFATIPLLTTSDADQQKVHFLDVWNSDGLAAEPEDDNPF